MRTIFLCILFFSLCLCTVYSQYSGANKEILKSMKEQEKAWNDVDLEGYMKYYWNSDSLKFIGKSGVTYGWKNTLEHYKKSYPDKAAMGVLTFDEIKLKKLSSRLVMVTGSWKLVRAKDELAGYYSLIWKKIKRKWVIIIDHTS